MKPLKSREGLLGYYGARCAALEGKCAVSTVIRRLGAQDRHALKGLEGRRSSQAGPDLDPAVQDPGPRVTGSEV